MKTREKGSFEEIWENRRAFVGMSLVVLFMAYSVLYFADFVPEPIEDAPVATPVLPAPAAPAAPAAPEPVANPMPVRIIIGSIGIDARVQNPATRDVATLDRALLSGVVRHPDSADLSEDGTMFILGHSSFLPTVHNLNYRAFNNIQKLYWGDEIRVRSADREYLYRVTRVYEAKASEAKVDLQWEKKMLVLATCNSFGSKDDRFVVEASFVESYAIDARGNRVGS